MTKVIECLRDDDTGIRNVITMMAGLHGTTPIALPKIPGIDQTMSVVAMPAGMELKSLKPLIDEYRKGRPDRIATTAGPTTAQAFVDYMNRFKDGTSAVFVSDNPDAPFVLGTLDYHSGNKVVSDIDGDIHVPNSPIPSFCTHKAVYSMPLSDGFKAWKTASGGGLMSQEMFADFLDNHLHDIENPPLDWGALTEKTFDTICDILNIHDDKGDIDDLSDDDPDDNSDRYIPRSAAWKLRRIRWGNQQRMATLSRGIEVSSSSRATSAYDPKTGARSVSFIEEQTSTTSSGRKVVVPDAFLIYIPVFEGGERHLMPVRLYHRVKGDKVAWGVELIDHRRVVRTAVRAAASTIGADTKLPVFYGRPE